MVNIIEPNTRTNVILNIDSGEITGDEGVPNSLNQLADQVGIVNTINEINQESIQADQNLRENYNIHPDSPEGHYTPEFNDEQSYQEPEQHEFEPENTPKKRTVRKKNKTADQRIRELSYQNLQTQQEKEELQYELKRMRDEHAAALLSFEKKRISNDIERVSDIMVQAKEEDETKTYVDANRVLHTLIHKESETDAALYSLKQSYEEQAPSYDYRAEEQRFYQLSDAKELNSDSYADWLRENSYYNPYDHENYDEDLSNDVHHLKRNFNKFLKSQQNGNFIGTDEYYQELNNLIKINLFGEHPTHNQHHEHYEDSNMGIRHTVHIDPSYDQSLSGAVPEGQTRMHGHYPDPEQYSPPMPPQRPQQSQQMRQSHASRVMPVNRAGYSSQYSPNTLPTLDATQRKLALSIPMVDMHGRPLSESERLYSYAEELSKMQRRS